MANTTTNPALLPDPALFDVTAVARKPLEGTLERVALGKIDLAPNARHEISEDGIAGLAQMLCRCGQLVPCIGHRSDPTGRIVLYDGQRRYLAAQKSRELAGTEGFEQLKPIRSLIVVLLDHAPAVEEIRRIQAQANAREPLSLFDQQEQFRDVWEARVGLGEEDRVAVVCADLGISARKAHHLRRQLSLPEPIRARVAERPAGEQISARMANRLADMNDVAPALTSAVAARISTHDLHEQALRDLGAFVHRTVVEDEQTYAVRIDDGALLDGHEQIAQARTYLDANGHEQLAKLLDCKLEKLDCELDTLAARARTRAMKVQITSEMRDRAANGRYAFVFQRGQDFAASIWVVDPVFMLDAINEQLGETDDGGPAREASYFAGASLNDEEMHDAAKEEQEQKRAQRERQGEAERSNLGLGHDLAAALIEPKDSQLQALKAIVCHLLASHYREVIAYGAGWSDRERQQPVGDTARYEPRHLDEIVEVELQRALEDPDPLRGIAQLTARWAAAFVLDPDGVTRTKALGSERMARKLADALPGGDNPLRAAVWEFLRPMLSPRLVALHRDSFVLSEALGSTVDLEAHRGESGLEELDLGEDEQAF